MADIIISSKDRTPADFSIRKSTQFKPSERFNTYAVNPQTSKGQRVDSGELDFTAQAGRVSGMGLPPLTSRNTSKKNYPKTEKNKPNNRASSVMMTPYVNESVGAYRPERPML